MWCSQLGLLLFLLGFYAVFAEPQSSAEMSFWVIAGLFARLSFLFSLSGSFFLCWVRGLLATSYSGFESFMTLFLSSTSGLYCQCIDFLFLATLAIY